MKYRAILFVLLAFLMACSSTPDSEGQSKTGSETPVTETEVPTETASEVPVETAEEDPVDSFESMAQKVAWALKNHDWDQLDTYIHPDTGIYFMDQPGAFTAVHPCKNMAEINKLFPWLDERLGEPEPDFKLSLSEGEAPAYNCGDMVFNKTGHYASSLGGCNRLSSVLEFLANPEMKMAKPQTLHCAQSLENFSRELIITNESGEDGLIFWLSQIDGKWWFSMLDIARTDCGA